MTFTQALIVASVLVSSADGFVAPTSRGSICKLSSQKSSFLGAVKCKDPPIDPSSLSENVGSFDPLGFARDGGERTLVVVDGSQRNDNKDAELFWGALTSSAALMTICAEKASAADIKMPQELMKSMDGNMNFDPNSFVPICGISDNFYRFLQGSAKAVVGAENFKEYGPLIASGLLRVRLELCVVESFINEAVGPFIRENGLGWVLPVHETVETFLAGTVFALATTFILVGSTKILTVIVTYADFLLGGPMRLLGGFAYDRARGKPVTLDIGFGPFKTRVIGPSDKPKPVAAKPVVVEGEDGEEVIIPATPSTDNKVETFAKLNENEWAVDTDKITPVNLVVIVLSGAVKFTGKVVGLLRDILDAVDLFVGKSLVLWVTFYVIVKFVHFKVFPDFPTFAAF